MIFFKSNSMYLETFIIICLMIKVKIPASIADPTINAMLISSFSFNKSISMDDETI